MNLRIDADADEHIRRAAAHEGLSVSAFVASAAKAAADRTLAVRAQFAFDPGAWDRFRELLDRPPRDLPGLVPQTPRGCRISAPTRVTLHSPRPPGPEDDLAGFDCGDAAATGTDRGECRRRPVTCGVGA